MKNSFILIAIFVFGIIITSCENSSEPNIDENPNTLLKSVGNSFVLDAANWGSKQTQSVEKAGGEIIFKHEQTGIAIVSSNNPQFLENISASKAFQNVTQDMETVWQPPTETYELEELAVTPGDETFINMQWNIKAIEASAAWDAGYTGQGVRVAVLDGGIYDSHIDLIGNIDVARSISFVTGFAFNQDLGTFWHGTHVAGIIAAKDNGIGTIGVAPNATIIGVKVLHNGSGSFGAIIAGILYAATPISEGGAGADIINMSLGATFQRGGGSTGAGPLIAALNKAVNYASKTALVISAAGNNGLDLDHSGSFITVPAQSGNGIAISATGPYGYAVGWPNGATNFSDPASYTNYGNSLIWVAAPGGDDDYPGAEIRTIPRVPSGTVTTFCWVFDMVISTVRGTGASTTTYSFADGTSMAAPAAAGVAALILQKYPGISVGALKNKLSNSAIDLGDLGHDPFYGHGFINAKNAVN